MGDPSVATDIGLGADTLRDIEHTAAELAALAGAEITGAFGRVLAVRYKGDGDDVRAFRDPVCEVDERVEGLIRERLARRFADHDVLGEEQDKPLAPDRDFVWAVDPIDGTTNFVNGFPLFAASIGVLYRNRPIVGALWCAVTHALRPGVYHARLGHPLRFENETVEPKVNPSIRRRLIGMPHAVSDRRLPWETRKTGSAAVECAFVAAGLLQVARFRRPNVWDIAGGVALVQASGGAVRARGERGWMSFTGFGPSPDEPKKPSSLRDWHRPIVLGELEAVARLCGET